METNKPSFLGSMFSGIKGYIKGALAGGLVGAVGGVVIGALIGLATGGTAAIAGAALVGAGYGASILAGMGALAGTITGVVKSREAHQIQAEDVVNVAKVTYAQGLTVGHQLGQAEAHEQTAFRDKVLQERAARGAGQQIH